MSGFAFTSPWLLAAFAVLPVLWWLLRVTPPAPTSIRFPAIRLLLGLIPPEETPAHTPLWLILMRMDLVALLILGLAHPLVNPSAALPGNGPLVLVVDDDWAAAADWPARQNLMRDLIDQAEREGRDVAVLPTAPGGPLGMLALSRPADARGLAQKLRPEPWPADRAGAAKRLDGFNAHNAAVYILSDGLDDAGAAALERRLQSLGPVHVVVPGAGDLPRLLAPGPADAQDLTVTVKRAVTGAAPPVRLRAVADDGRQIGQAEGSFAADRTSVDIPFKLPVELRNRIDRIEIESAPSAGSVLLLDDQARRRPVGIATDTPNGSAQPLLSDTYYVERALQPFSDLRRGGVAGLIAGGIAMLVLPDGDAGLPADHTALAKWIDGGGVLLRFAGPLLADAEDDDLLPVALRHGDRTIGGAMSWEEPAHLAAFPPASPFAGLAVPDDVTVTRQVLAEPAVDLAAKTWARLSDGTPLVTGEQRGKGWVVLVHTTANTAWSNLALSGLFVDMMRRLTLLGPQIAGSGAGVLPPWQIMDGLGRLSAAPATAQPVQLAELPRVSIGPAHPPGFYGTEDSHRALNLAQSVPALKPLGELPAGVARDSYQRAPELDLRPWLLGAAFLLGLIDLVVGYWLRGLVRFDRRATAAVLLSMMWLIHPAQAQTRPTPTGPDATIIEATSQLRLAYVRTGDTEIDRQSRAGLVGLDNVLSRRTSVETGDPMAVDVEHDELIFFPLIYWPVTTTQPALSPEAAERVNRYLATGGTILFDTQDQGTAVPGAGNEMAARLNTLLTGVHIPPLVPVPADHVLTKSFYLMQDFPGRWVGGTVWVEPSEDHVNDGVSTVVLGSNDWAAAWAVDAQGFPSLPVVPGGEVQREQAYRFGVNLVMYALTGNYKSDQVHVPAILERLGQ